MRIVHSDQRAYSPFVEARKLTCSSLKTNVMLRLAKTLRTNTKRRSNDKSPSVRTNSHSGAQSNNCCSLSHFVVNHEVFPLNKSSKSLRGTKENSEWTPWEDWASNCQRSCAVSTSAAKKCLHADIHPAAMQRIRPTWCWALFFMSYWTLNSLFFFHEFHRRFCKNDNAL